MRPQGWQFRPRLVPSIAALLVIVLTVGLGNWQRGRAATKRTQQALYAARASEPVIHLAGSGGALLQFEGRRAELRGTPLNEASILLDNRIADGRAGYWVLTPIRAAGAETAVLILRGWAPLGSSRDRPPAAPDMAESATIHGVVIRPPSPRLRLGDDKELPAGPVWSELDLRRYQRVFRFPVADAILQQRNDTMDGLRRRWPEPGDGSARNSAYAMQWYSFAVLTLILYVGLNLKRRA
jgi:surfeit locus 1 family protein